MPSEAVLYVRDLDLMVAFYTRCLELSAGDHGAGYRGLRDDSFTVWLLEGNQTAESLPERAAAGSRRSDVPVKLCFEVPSLERAVAAVSSLSGWISPRRWEFAGYLRQDVADPEGNIIQLLERAA